MMIQTNISRSQINEHREIQINSQPLALAKIAVSWNIVNTNQLSAYVGKAIKSAIASL